MKGHRGVGIRVYEILGKGRSVEVDYMLCEYWTESFRTTEKRWIIHAREVSDLLFKWF